ncbi:hypothetical protein, partial [Sphingobium sp. WCS2017Hpa-17]|uniref:hypothetical protein n=1 Tax=Sphingobium sp. WCS2017Hpa-17 TaxID=3073638 RepID=UPI00288A7959
PSTTKRPPVAPSGQYRLNQTIRRETLPTSCDMKSLNAPKSTIARHPATSQHHPCPSISAKTKCRNVK